jgi:hypothetical protein
MYQRVCAVLVDHSRTLAIARCIRANATTRCLCAGIVGMKCVERIIHWNPFPAIGPLAAIFWDDLFLQGA